MSDNMPDFDNMSPEEIMRWMETLAKNQGATEGFTTAADAQIAEIDPNTVVIDEPGYVPYDTKIGGNKPPAPTPPKQTPVPAAPPPPAPVQTAPPLKPQPPAAAPAPSAPPPMPARPAPMSQPPPASAQAAPPAARPPAPPQRPPAAPPQPPARPAAPPPPPPAPQPVSSSSGADEGALAWLENLANEQQEGLFNLDLSGSVTPDLPPVDDSMAWLENLAATGTPPPTAAADPYATGENPIAWLERLAREKGGKADEMTTSAPQPDLSALGADIEPLPPQDPSSFLESLAASEGYDEIGVTATRAPSTPPSGMDDIERAVAAGTATRDQMQQWLDAQTDRLLEEPDMTEYVEVDPDAPLVPAEMPDWLLESLGTPPAQPSEPERPSIESLFPETEAAPSTSDWLSAAIGAPAPLEIDSIFADQDDEQPASVSASEAPVIDIGADEADTWAEAFDEEYRQDEGDITEMPEWYARNLSDPERIAAVEKLGALPEEDKLQLGEAQPVPDWMSESTIAPPAPPFGTPTPADAEPMPDWMAGLEDAVSPEEIPAWLLETIEETPSSASDIDVTSFTIEAEPEPEPEPVAPPAPPVRPTPPPPAPVRVAPVAPSSAAITEARRLQQSGDLVGSLAQYEGLIRGMVDLDDVVDDLSSLASKHRDNPAIFRVLGDGLMRQGKLQQALDTYRQALNQL